LYYVVASPSVCWSRAVMPKAAVDLSPEPAPCEGEHHT
jgi:hypothetical protein